MRPAQSPPPAVAAALQLARDYEQRGQADMAERTLDALVASAPECAPALYRLGVYAARRQDVARAAGLFGRVLALEPGNMPALTAYAAACLESGQKDAAFAAAERLRATGAGTEALTLLGIVFRQANENDMALALLDDAVKADPHCVAAWYAMQQIRRFEKDDPRIALLKQMREGDALLSPEDRIKLEFMLGTAHMQWGEADAAFRHFAEGHRLRRSGYAYDVADFERYVDSIITLFDAALVEKFSGAGHASERPVFVVGMPRSGSTLTEMILTSHPEASGMGEVGAFSASLPVFANVETPALFQPGQPSITRELVEKMSPDMLAEIGRRYVARTDAPAAGAARLVDKMLSNFAFAGLIRLALPQARIIHCTRDPMDIGLSLWQLNFPRRMPWASDQRETGRYYLAYRKLMAHWDRLFPGALHEANYEAMVADTEGETRKLLAYCGLPWDARCLAFHESARTVKTSSDQQVRKPVYTGSAGKWRKYADYLKPLAETLEAAKGTT